MKIVFFVLVNKKIYACVNVAWMIIDDTRACATP